MKKINEICGRLAGIIPEDAEKNILFCEVENTAYEIFYYSLYGDGRTKHSSEIIDEGNIDVSVVQKGFDNIAKFIRNSEVYNPEQRNVITVTINGSAKRVEVAQYDKSVGLYKIKKEWKLANIS